MQIRTGCMSVTQKQIDFWILEFARFAFGSSLQFVHPTGRFGLFLIVFHLSLISPCFCLRDRLRFFRRTIPVRIKCKINEIHPEIHFLLLIYCLWGLPFLSRCLVISCLSDVMWHQDKFGASLMLSLPHAITHTQTVTPSPGSNITNATCRVQGQQHKHKPFSVLEFEFC